MTLKSRERLGKADIRWSLSKILRGNFMPSAANEPSHIGFFGLKNI
jgi:hypothetical protein